MASPSDATPRIHFAVRRRSPRPAAKSSARAQRWVSKLGISSLLCAPSAAPSASTRALRERGKEDAARSSRAGARLDARLARVRLVRDLRTMYIDSRSRIALLGPVPCTRRRRCRSTTCGAGTSSNAASEQLNRFAGLRGARTLSWTRPRDAQEGTSRELTASTALRASTRCGSRPPRSASKRLEARASTQTPLLPDRHRAPSGTPAPPAHRTCEDGQSVTTRIAAVASHPVDPISRLAHSQMCCGYVIRRSLPVTLSRCPSTKCSPRPLRPRVTHSNALLCVPQVNSRTRRGRRAAGTALPASTPSQAPHRALIARPGSTKARFKRELACRARPGRSRLRRARPRR